RRRAGHDGRRGPQVHRLDGRRGAASAARSGDRSARRRHRGIEPTRQQRIQARQKRATESTNQDRKTMSSMRTHYCGLVTEELLGQTVSLCGWVHRRRDHGGVIFIDLRDREGLVQVVCHPDNADVFKAAEHVRNEYCLRVTGTVVNRLEGTANANLKSGKIEINTTQLEVLNASVPVPFQLDDDNLSETTRLTHRVLDLRRQQMQHNLRLRYKVSMEVRKYLDNLGFIDVETPMLGKSTPEGARDYLVPSRVNPGTFFALPQSPQLFKQLLMVANFDRYYQITKCFRDEDLRADRQPEFTQIDCETSFLTEQEIRDLFEDMMRTVFKNAAGIDLPNPFPVMDFATAMGLQQRRQPAERPRRRPARAAGRLDAAFGNRRVHAVRRHLRRQGPCLHQGQREGQGPRWPAVADREEPVGRRAGESARADRRRRRRPDFLRRGQGEDRQRRDGRAAREDRSLGIRQEGRPVRRRLGTAVGHRLPDVRVRRGREPLDRDAPPVHGTEGRPRRHARVEPGRLHRQGLRHGAERLGTGRRLDPYPPRRSPEQGVPRAEDRRGRSAAEVRLPARRPAVRRPAARRPGVRPGSPDHADDRFDLDPRRDRVPENPARAGPADQRAVGSRREAAERAAHPPA
ncbi:hypothetical protein Lal_00014946, partial [Lupinus albus]